MLCRYNDHRAGSGFTDKIRKITLEPFKDRNSACEAEIEAIKNERPRFNKLHQKKRKKK